MAEYRTVKTRIWDDPWFSRLDPDAKLYWFYLITNPRASVAGIYVLRPAVAAAEAGLPLDRVVELDGQFEAAGKIAREDDVIWVIKLREHQETQSPMVRRRIDEDLSVIPNCDLKRRYISHYSGEKPVGTPHVRGIDTVSTTRQNQSDTVSIPYQYPVDTVSDGDFSAGDTVFGSSETIADTVSIPYSAVFENRPADTCTETDTEKDTCTEREKETENITPPTPPERGGNTRARVRVGATCSWCIKPKPDTEGVQYLLQQWHDRYRRATGRCPVGFASSAGAVFKSLLREVGESEILRAVDNYLASTDAWIVEHAYPVTKLRSDFNALRDHPIGPGNNGSRAGPRILHTRGGEPATERTWEDEVLEKMRRRTKELKARGEL